MAALAWAALARQEAPVDQVAAACLPWTADQTAQAATDADSRPSPVVREDVTSDRGELLGYRLRVGLSNGTEFAVDLPPESFVAEQVGALVLFGHGSPDGSEIRAVDVRSGCAALLARPTDVVRSAVLDRAGENLYVHSVTRAGRLDAGVVRHELATGRSDQVTQPIARDPELGRGWETGLLWNLSGTALAVEPCTMVACTTRVLDVTDGSVRDVRGFHGPTIGFTDTHLFTYGAGDDWPTDVLKVDFSGRVQVVANDVVSASLSRHTGGRLLIETTAGQRAIDP